MRYLHTMSLLLVQHLHSYFLCLIISMSFILSNCIQLKYNEIHIITDFLRIDRKRERDLLMINYANTITRLIRWISDSRFFLHSSISFYICFADIVYLYLTSITFITLMRRVLHISSIFVVHNTLVLTICHFFWSPLTLQDTSYSPEPHISAEHSQSLLSAQEAVSLWVLGTRKVCILTRLRSDDAILIHLFAHKVAIVRIYDAPIFYQCFTKSRADIPTHKCNGLSFFFYKFQD